MDYFGADNTFAMADHADHVHVGYAAPSGTGPGSVSKQFSQILKPDQWERLIDRLGEIDNPTVPTAPSDAALPDRQGQADEVGPQARLERPHRRVARGAALPLRPARARRDGRASTTAATSAVTPSGCWWSERRRRPAPAPPPPRPREAQGRRPRGREPRRPADDADRDPPRGARRGRGGRGLARPACAATPRRSRRRSPTRSSSSTAPCTPTARRPSTRRSPTSAPRAALAVRVGFGTGDELADGRYSEAIDVPHVRAPPPRRAAAPAGAGRRGARPARPRSPPASCC